MPGEARSGSAVIVLFRRDLRVSDNRALAAAARHAGPVVPLFILDETSPGVRPTGAASRWWLHHSLKALAGEMKRRRGKLHLHRGRTAAIVERAVRETGASAVFWNRRYDPAESAVDAELKKALRAKGVTAESFDGALLHEPTLLRTQSGTPYKVYTPFWRAVRSGDEPRDPVDAPRSVEWADLDFPGDELDAWRLLPREPDWAAGLRDRWEPGEDGAKKRLRRFLEKGIDRYEDNRDLPAVDGTSGLSPHLAFGEITPFQVFAAVRRAEAKGRSADIERFRKEIVWREFCYHLLVQKPDLATSNFDPTFDRFRWEKDPASLKAWQRGMTGYPIVDAGMRELWATGVMHNRVRMIAASFLIKDLLIDWRQGEQWFWDTLVDADLANNPGNWQWVAGSGADASPYFRIFNPVTQGEKFDPRGGYVRRWVPELAKLPDKWVHKPFDAPDEILAAAGVKLGSTYPVPLIDHGEARSRAMAAYRQIKGQG